MNRTLSATPRRPDHPPQPGSESNRPRVGLLDRLAMHLGVELITWSLRGTPVPLSREQLALLRDQQLERARLRRELDQMLLLHRFR